MSASALLLDWLRREIAPSLVQYGFKRTGYLYRRSTPLHESLIAFQRSSRSSDQTCVFTATLGVWSRKVAEFHEGAHASCSVKLETCHWTCRLGELLNPPEDRWWTLENSDRHLSSTREVQRLVLDRGVPLLLEMSSDTRLRDLWLSGDGPGLTSLQRLQYLAVLLKDLGPRASFDPTIRQLTKQSAGKPIAGYVRSLIFRLTEE